MHEHRHISVTRGLASLLRAVYPHECLGCRVALADASGLCGECWRDTPFILGDVCETCGTPMQGDVQAGDQCDDCVACARPWVRGRAALVYKDRARQLVLALKHGDRHDIVRPAARWMALALGDGVPEGTMVLPVPLHWTRMLRRRFNQSALLARSLAGHLDRPYCADGLTRKRATLSLDGKSRDERFREIAGAIEVTPKRRELIKGRSVLLVDDVMTSGATLAACADACLAAQVREVHIVTLARVAKDT